MIQKNWKLFLIVCVVIMIFPVLFTLIVSKINMDKKSVRAVSGKTIRISSEGYTTAMDMEEFIPCVLMAQMSIESPQELLKAQAVVIRTYILRQMGNEDEISTDKLGLPYISYGKLRDIWFREYRMKHSDTIGGMLGNLTGIGGSRIFESNCDYLHKIIEKTDMKVLKSNGEFILPLYHRISSGKTRSGKEVLGKEYSYLKSTKCETDMEEKDYLGVTYVSMEELKDKLKASGIVIYKDKKELFENNNIDLQDFISMIDISKKDKTGHVLAVTVADTKIPAEKFAEALGVNSTVMAINEYEKGVRITTKGSGHGFGMSLAYGEQMAKDGIQWQRILKTFYDATISDY